MTSSYDNNDNEINVIENLQASNTTLILSSTVFLKKMLFQSFLNGIFSEFKRLYSIFQYTLYNLIDIDLHFYIYKIYNYRGSNIIIPCNIFRETFLINHGVM